MKTEVASEVLRAYPGRKLDIETAKEIVRRWAEASGWELDRWGNYHTPSGMRIKITKRQLQRQTKRGGTWSNVSSTPLVEAAHNLVAKAAEAAGDEAVLAKVTGAKAQRAEVAGRRQEKAKQAEVEAEIGATVAKLLSVEDPEGFVAHVKLKQATPAFAGRAVELTRELRGLRERGRVPTDGELFSSYDPPLAPLLVEADAQWVEQVRDVPYTISVAHSRAKRDTAVIEIGATGGLGSRVDPVTRVQLWEPGHREGDAYLSGRITWTPKGPIAVLFMIIAQQKQTGAGSRLLDLWCRMMDAYGADVWGAEAVGPEGQLFLEAKVRDGRLRLLSRDGSNWVVACEGGDEARQQRLKFNPADIRQFPEQPRRVTIGSRTYALSDIGVPVAAMLTEQERHFEEMEDFTIIQTGADPYRYVWVYEPRSQRLEMYRYSDGDWKVLGVRADYPGTFRDLEQRRQLNTVTPDELVEFEREMRRRNEEMLVQLQEAVEEAKTDEHREVDRLVAEYWEAHVEPEVARAWGDIDRGVFPFDFRPSENLEAHGVSRERQAKSHVLSGIMERTGFAPYDSPLERFVIERLGREPEDVQAIQWAVGDFLHEWVYPQYS